MVYSHAGGQFLNTLCSLRRYHMVVSVSRFPEKFFFTNRIFHSVFVGSLRALVKTKVDDSVHWESFLPWSKLSWKNKRLAEGEIKRKIVNYLQGLLYCDEDLLICQNFIFLHFYRFHFVLWLCFFVSTAQKQIELLLLTLRDHSLFMRLGGGEIGEAML